MPAYDLAGYSFVQSSVIIMIIACCESKIFLSRPAGTTRSHAVLSKHSFVFRHLFKRNRPTQCW